MRLLIAHLWFKLINMPRLCSVLGYIYMLSFNISSQTSNQIHEWILQQEYIAGN